MPQATSIWSMWRVYVSKVESFVKKHGVISYMTIPKPSWKKWNNRKKKLNSIRHCEIYDEFFKTPYIF